MFSFPILLIEQNQIKTKKKLAKKKKICPLLPCHMKFWLEKLLQVRNMQGSQGGQTH